MKSQIKNSFAMGNIENQPYKAKNFANGLNPDFSINGRLTAIV